MIRRILSASTFATALVVASSVASALSNGVISNYRGQLVISKDELPEGKNDHDTLTKINALRLKEVEGEAKEDVQYWRFHYTAFLTRTGADKLTLEFLKPDGKLSANQRLEDVDPKSSVLSGDIAIDEDQGLAKGKTYTVQLVTAGDQVVAKTTLLMK
jgi:hypothetical protein